jgi:26S proteasome regulatory subunit N11
VLHAGGERRLTEAHRQETVVGWYHSHPGFGCWLSSVDINTQQSFEQLTPRAVAVVVDPIQSVKGKVVIDAFRLINPQTLMMGHEPRQTTSNVGHLNKPSIQALIHGLNRHYYSIGINYRKTGLEENMLMNLHKHVWTEALLMDDFRDEGAKNNDRLQKLVSLSEGYEKRVKEETELTKDQLKTRYVGKVDPKKRKSISWAALSNYFRLDLLIQSQTSKTWASSSSKTTSYPSRDK